MQITTKIIIKMINPVSFHESDRFYQYLMHLMNPKDQVNLIRDSDSKFLISFSKHDDMRRYVLSLVKGKKNYPLEFQDVEHIDFSIDMIVNDVNEHFTFYDNDVVLQTLERMTEYIDDHDKKLTDIIDFINGTKLNQYVGFRDLVLDVLETNKLIKKTVTELPGHTIH